MGHPWEERDGKGKGPGLQDGERVRGVKPFGSAEAEFGIGTSNHSRGGHYGKGRRRY